MTIKLNGKFFTDAESLSALTDKMLTHQKYVYESYGALEIEAAFPNRKMIVYTLNEGRPENITTLLFGNIEILNRVGPTVIVSDEIGTITLGVIPVKWRDRDLFLQVPQNFVFRWCGKLSNSNEVQFVPNYAVLVKTRSKEFHQISGHTYCTTLNKFNNRFPEIKIKF